MKRPVRGFTLIELLVVMAVIGLLLSIAAPRFVHQVDPGRPRRRRCVTTSTGLREAIDQFHTDKGRLSEGAAGPRGCALSALRARWTPITERVDTWIMVLPEGDPGPAWYDVHSGARGLGADGTSYATW